MARKRQRVVIDGVELSLSLMELHEELKARGHYERGYDTGPAEGGGVFFNIHEHDGSDDDAGQGDA